MEEEEEFVKVMAKDDVRLLLLLRILDRKRNGVHNLFIDTDGCEAVLDKIAHPTQVKIGNQLNLFLLAVAE